MRRRWTPRLGRETLWQRFRRRIKGTARRAAHITSDADPGCALDAFDELAVVLVVLLIVLLAIFVVVPLLVAIVDVVVLVLLGVLGLLARIVLRRPWIVEARAADGTSRRWKVVGWRASQERRDEIAGLVAAGITPPGGEADDAGPADPADPATTRQ